MKTLFIILITLVTPLVSFAQGRETFDNPLIFPNVQSIVTALVQALIVMLIPVVMFFIIFAGFKYVTARGNPNTIKEANKALLYALIGGVIIIGAVAITQIVKNTVDQFRPTTFETIILPINYYT